MSSGFHRFVSGCSGSFFLYAAASLVCLGVGRGGSSSIAGVDGSSGGNAGGVTPRAAAVAAATMKSVYPTDPERDFRAPNVTGIQIGRSVGREVAARSPHRAGVASRPWPN